MDLIIKNARVITMDDKKNCAEAVGIKDGKILKVGDNEEIMSGYQSYTKVIDLNGKLLIPGFNDSHMHLLSFGLSLQRVNLTDSKSVEEIILRTHKFILENNIEVGKWVQGTGWNHDYFDKKVFPTRYDLDKISTENPICIIRTCYHIAVVNSKALEILNITKDSRQIAGGLFDVDDSGEPLGIFRENALRLIYDFIPEPDVSEIKDAIHKAVLIASSRGITSIQTDDFEHIPSKDYEKIMRAYNELHEEGRLNVRINEQCLLPDMSRLNDFIEKGYITGKGNDFFKIGPLKLLADGSLGARTALLFDAYSDDRNTCGISIYSQEQLDELVIKAHEKGLQIAVHCIGDKAMHMALNSIEKAQSEYPREDCRHSIVHCQITSEDLMKRFKRLNIIAHIQPIFLNYDLHIAKDRIGIERTKTAYNWKTLLNEGVTLAIGTDCPVENINALQNVYSAVTRMDLNGYPKNGWMPEQRLTVYETVYGYTMGAAYASFEDKEKGSVSEGKFADFSVLSEDIFNIEPERIKDVKVLMTIVGGRITYSTMS